MVLMQSEGCKLQSRQAARARIVENVSTECRFKTQFVAKFNVSLEYFTILIYTQYSSICESYVIMKSDCVAKRYLSD